jgi:hypothetical protein
MIVGIIGGALVAAWMLAAAWDHNPQEEFHGVTGVHWAAWLPMGLAWFVAVAVALTLAARMLVFLHDGDVDERSAEQRRFSNEPLEATRDDREP